MDIRSKEKGLVRKPGEGQGWWGVWIRILRGSENLVGWMRIWWLEEGKGCGRGPPMKYSESA